jgi:hypothetical protein
MPLDRDRLLDIVGTHRQTEVVYVDGIGEVRLRRATFSEWYDVVREHAKHEGVMIPDSVIAVTVATALAAEDGSRLLSRDEAEYLLNLPPRPLMRLYQEAKRVLDLSDNAVEAEAKN